MTRVWGIHNDEVPASELVADGFISIGWERTGDLAKVGNDQARMRELVQRVYPDAKEGAVPVWAGVLRRFAFELRQGDVVIAADRQARLINIGLIAGPYRYYDGGGSVHPHRHDVEWLVTGVPRTNFSQPALNEIGSAVTLFEVRRHAHEFVETLAGAGHPLEIRIAPAGEMDRGEDNLRNLSDEYLRAMRTGDSAFTPGRSIWTLPTVRELERAFVDRPDLGGRSFDLKLDDQLAEVSDEALQLFAEVWCMSLAPLSDYMPATKRQLLQRILTKMKDPVRLPGVVDAALDAGAFKGGVAFKTRRPYQLALLLRIASAVLSLSDEDRVAALSDPKTFEGLLASIVDPNEPAQRSALRWFLFPDYYLPIVSDKHRRAIREAFADLLDGTAANLDEELNQIKNALSEDGISRVEFYRPPLVDQWDPGRVLSGVPPTLEQVVKRKEFKTPRYALASAAVGTLDEGRWTTYTDIAEVAGLVAGQVGDYLDKVHHDAGHRVTKIDGSTYEIEQREALEAEGIQFNAKGAADPDRRVTKEDLRERLDALGLLPKVSRRAWMVRGSNVKGEDLVPAWIKEGRVTLAATSLRKVEAGLTRDQLRPIVDEDYAHASYAARAEKLDDFHAFLSRMQPGHLVVTIHHGSLYIGEIGGEASYQSTTDMDARLIRSVEWRADATPVDGLPADLAVRLTVQRDVLDLTQHLDLLEKLLVAEGSSPVPVDEAPLVLRDATDELASALHVDRPWLQECIELLKDRPQMIFYGPPGTGKTYIALALAEHLAGENVRLVQFHPSYSYEDFFEGFRPTADGGFELKPGPMRRIVDQAVANPKEAHVLIIDEINRGNLAKVFGELYFLLEYRDRNVELLYGDGDFSLPANVFIIGTMNTADRSIALVDTAMRRRFAFLALHPSELPIRDVLRAWLKKADRPERVADLLAELNRRITDPDFRIGPSYFMREKVFVEGGLERTWRTTILPLLEEHHFGEMTGVEVDASYGYAVIAATVDRKVVESDDSSPQTD